ncbi:MAG: amino acid permease [Bacteroidota bacterium]
MPKLDKEKKLSKELKAFDVFAIATGAMFSSGLFLLPGVAAGVTGPSVFLAYLVSGILVMPTMFSKAELTTAFPRAGGTYYIIDRSLGPLIGSIGGFGSWFSLVFKSAFALIGMGAYISIFFDVPITPIALTLSLAFGALNIFGAKETSKFQNILVIILISIMAFYIVQGFAHVFSLGFLDVHREQFTPFFTGGAQGFIATVGMVFVSYAGLTKVASVAEEVDNPDRNIPRGMFYSMFTAISIYVIGVYLMTAVLEPSAFREDLTPVATAGEVFLTWLPGDTGLILVVIAAIAAFASTANAGIMSASRFPLAMARDSLINKQFSKISKFNTPMISIIATTGMMVVILLVFNVSEVAKLASAFKLLLFGLVNFAVIVMRESKIEEYDPGYRSPLYPWLQLLGMVASAVLIFYMGTVSIVFTIIVAVFSIGWYYYYSQGKVERQGAIFHVYDRLGQYKDSGLKHEMRRILREKGVRDEDPFELIVSQATVKDLDEAPEMYKDIVDDVCSEIGGKLSIQEGVMLDEFLRSRNYGAIPLGNGAALSHTRLDADIHPQLYLVRIKNGLDVEEMNLKSSGWSTENDQKKLYAIFFLIGSENKSSQHLRFLAQLAEMVDQDNFQERWLNAENEAELREVLLRNERFINIKIDPENKTKEFIGKALKDIPLPGQSLVTLLRRGDETLIPHGSTILQEDDILSIIGNADDIEELSELKKQ